MWLCAWCQVADIEKAERDKMRGKVNAIIDHGINCFVNRQLIYNFPEEIFADAGIMAIEHADFDGIERLALVTGGAHEYLIVHLLGTKHPAPSSGVSCRHDLGNASRVCMPYCSFAWPLSQL